MRSIVFVVPFFNFGGFEKSILRIAGYLNHYKPEIIITENDPSANLDLLNEVFSKVSYLGKESKVFKNAKAFRLNRLLQRYNVVISLYDRYCASVSGFYCDKLYISLLRNHHPTSYARSVENHQYFDVFAGNSTKITRELQNRLPNNNKSRIELLPNGINIGSIKKKYDRLDQSSLKLIFVGRIINEAKNVFSLPEISKGLSDQNIDHQITVLGDGTDLLRLKRLTTDLRVEQNFMFLGNCSNEDVKLKMLEADVLLFTSFYEGLPNVILEAMSLGLIVVSSKLDGITTDFISHGENGFLVENNVSDYVSEISRIRVLDNLQWISDNAVNTVRLNFSMERERQIINSIVLSDIVHSRKYLFRQELINPWLYRLFNKIIKFKSLK
ncbi:glycosyltransferase family 4 protein [Flavobacteriaceae bacterium]|nr:glycosyltransferase family 4 protein [Flavobacteriaceae bacterium]